MNDQLRDELLRRVEEEQALRAQWIDQKENENLTSRIEETDARNTSWLEKVIEEQGFPGVTLLGEEGTQALFLLIQHSPNLEFQKKCLTLMEAAEKQGEIAPIHLAYLTDRVRMREEKPQIYGTQGRLAEDGRVVPYAIEDKEHVDERRQDIGLEPIAQYFKRMNEMYKTESKR
jgi:hypothetical protein